MRILVLNGSPKGEVSVTMQYVAFIQKKFPEHEFDILHISQQVRYIENNESAYNHILSKIATADAVLWAFPLYFSMVHGNFKRFIELIVERKGTEVFHHKHTAILTTSIHFFDHTAHQYVHGICDDWEMKFYDGYSADMQDLYKESERERLLKFFHGFFRAIQFDDPAAKVFFPISHQVEYVPQSEREVVPVDSHKVVILTDYNQGEDPINLGRMIEQMSEIFGGQAQVVYLQDILIKGGCLGCLRCGYDNTCAYQGKDEYVDFFNNTLKPADVLIFAGSIRDRYLSSTWKTFFDRSFFNTHIPYFSGKQIGFLISGPLQQLPNLREILEGYVQLQQANLVNFVTDEEGESPGKTDRLLVQLAKRSIEYANCRYVKPLTFLGVGGRKIFRDEIWGTIRFPFRADHQYYGKHGFYDFPQRNYGVRLRNFFLSLITRLPSVRKEIYHKQMIYQMVKPFQKLIDKL